VSPDGNALHRGPRAASPLSSGDQGAQHPGYETERSGVRPHLVDGAGDQQVESGHSNSYDPPAPEWQGSVTGCFPGAFSLTALSSSL
jgi:hypothetical protein